jgi:hypothetical protein
MTAPLGMAFGPGHPRGGPDSMGAEERQGRIGVGHALV